MKLHYSELLSQSGVIPPAADPVAPDALERIRERTMKQIKTKPRLSRRAVALLTAAAIFAAMSLTAGAVYIAMRATNQDLMAAGPLTGGREPQQIDETASTIIDEATQTLAMGSADSETTVTLDSVMGFATEQLSVMYLTLNVDYPAGTVFDCGAQDLGFVRQHLEFTEGLRASGSGSSVAVLNDDGTCSVMMMYEFEADLSGREVTLEFEDFGNVSKENMHEFSDGTAEPAVSGEWSFTFELSLDAPETVEFDAALFDDAVTLYDGKPFRPVKIELCEFGGALTLEDDTVFLTEIALELTDGTIYEGVFRQFGQGNDETGEWHFTNGFVFEVPQQLEAAAALIIDGVRVPLN